MASEYTHQRSGFHFRRRANGEVWIQMPYNELGYNVDLAALEAVAPREVMLTAGEWAALVAAMGQQKTRERT